MRGLVCSSGDVADFSWGVSLFLIGAEGVLFQVDCLVSSSGGFADCFLCLGQMGAPVCAPGNLAG